MLPRVLAVALVASRRSVRSVGSTGAMWNAVLGKPLQSRGWPVACALLLTASLSRAGG